MRFRRTRRALSTAVVIAGGLLGSGYALIGQAPTSAPQPTALFAERIAVLSEPGGYFDTDNLISNERTFLSVLPGLRAAGVRGGAYLGVGPDQNFSYIAAIRPSVAVLVDIRRDNLLLHLLFKALFAESDTRVTYLANLCGRTPPPDAPTWRARSVDQIVTYVAQAPAQPASVAELRERLARRVRSFGVPLSVGDLQTILRFHGRFIEDGLDLQFQSTGRAPQSYYPTLRDLVLGTDPRGARASYLADEDAFQFLRAMQSRDAIVPAVGDLSGTTAMTAIARFLRAENLRVSAFYTSNVEFYLDRTGSYTRFVENVRRLPWAENGVIIRSHFTGGGSVSEIEAAAAFLR